MESIILIPIFTAMLSVITSVFVTTLTNKSEFQRIRKEHEQGYEKSLFQKRIELYPKLYCLLSDYTKIIEYGKQNRENLIRLRDEIDKWNSENSIFFSPNTTYISARFRLYLAALLDDRYSHPIGEEDWKFIKRISQIFESSLKADIGVFDLPTVGVTPMLSEAYQLLDREIKRLTGVTELDDLCIDIFLNSYEETKAMFPSRLPHKHYARRRTKK